MSFKKDFDYRLVADIGSWNFRYSCTGKSSKDQSNSNNEQTIYNYKSRVGRENKSGKVNLISEKDSNEGFVDETVIKYQNVFTKSVMTNFNALDHLFGQVLNSHSIVNEKR